MLSDFPRGREPRGRAELRLLAAGLRRPRRRGGAVVRLNGHPFTVAGVVPAGFHGLSPVEAAPDVWVPVTMQPVLSPDPADFLRRVENQTVTWLQVVGRLRPDVPLEVARERLAAVNAALVEEFPAWGHEGQQLAVVEDFRFEPETRGRIVRYARLLMDVVVLVLAIAGANVAILLLARGAARRRDLGVRLALGAGRAQIVRQLLAESFLLALAGAGGGFLLAFWSAGVAARALPFDFVVGFTPDLTVLAFAVAAAVATAIVFGLAPALGAARTDVVAVLKLGTSHEGRSWLRDGLVVAQVALSIVLVGAAALFVRSLGAAESVNLGLESERRLLVTLNLSNHGYDEETGARFVEQVLERLAPLPGVTGVSAAALVPFHGSWTSSFEAEGVERAEGGRSRKRSSGCSALPGERPAGDALRVARPGARRRGALRRAGLPGGPAYADDRHPHGPGGQRPAGGRGGDGPRAQADRGGHRPRRGGGAVGGGAGGELPLRGRAARPVELHGGGGDPRRGGLRGGPAAGLTGGARRSDRGLARRVVFSREPAAPGSSGRGSPAGVTDRRRRP